MSKVIQPDGGEVNSTYWPTGELKRTWGSRTYPVEYVYDDQGRMKTLTTWQDFAGDSGRAVTTWNYEPTTGRLQQKVYDDGKGPSYTYSAAGRLLTRTWARKVNGQDLVTTYTYTSARDLGTVDYSNTPGPLKDVVYGFDRQGRQISITDSTGTRTTSYTAAGQPDAVTWQDGLLAGMALDYTQDNLLRPAGYTLTRDAQPQPETVTATSYGYDVAGRFDTVTAGTDVFTYSYLPNSGLVDTVTARHGATEIMKTVKNWDNLNRLTSIENRNGADVPARVYSSHAYGYNAANQRTEAVREDVTKWAYGYDDLGQVTSGVKKKQDGTPLPGLSFGYLFDDIGNRREATTNVGGTLRAATYSANLLNQYSQRTVPGVIDLLGEAAPDATVTVNNQPTVRDGALFFKSLTVNNTASAVSQDVHVVGVKNDVGPLGEDAVTEVQGKRFVPQTPEGFTYDDDGNLTSDGRWSYEWDAENRLVAIETLNALPASVTKQRLEFAYDSQSRRVSKKVSHWAADHWALGSETRFVYDLWNLIAEFTIHDSQFTIHRSHVWGLDLSGSLQGAGGVGGLLSSYSFSSSSWIYFAFDGNGNVMALVDAMSGAETAMYEYDPFGNIVLQTGAAAGANAFRFSTKYQDGETGLVYYGYRYYAPGIGRWVSRDPAGERGGYNCTAFIQNNPVTLADFLGLEDASGTVLDLASNGAKYFDLRDKINAIVDSNGTPYFVVQLTKITSTAPTDTELFRAIRATRVGLPDDYARWEVKFYSHGGWFNTQSQSWVTDDTVRHPIPSHYEARLKVAHQRDVVVAGLLAQGLDRNNIYACYVGGATWRQRGTDALNHIYYYSSPTAALWVDEELQGWLQSIYDNSLQLKGQCIRGKQTRKTLFYGYDD